MKHIYYYKTKDGFIEISDLSKAPNDLLNLIDHDILLDHHIQEIPIIREPYTKNPYIAGVVIAVNKNKALKEVWRKYMASSEKPINDKTSIKDPIESTTKEIPIEDPIEFLTKEKPVNKEYEITIYSSFGYAKNKLQVMKVMRKAGFSKSLKDIKNMYDKLEKIKTNSITTFSNLSLLEIKEICNDLQEAQQPHIISDTESGRIISQILPKK